MTALSFKLLRTSTFKLVAVYLLLFAISSGAVLAYIYWNTAGLLERQTDDTIRAEITGLAEQYGQGGLRRLLATINARSRDAGDSIYLLADFVGRKVGGNLSAPPENLPAGEGWVEFPYRPAGGESKDLHDARAYLFRLPGGFLLLVGRDVHDRRLFAGLIRQSFYWAIGPMLVLGLVGGFLISRNFLGRVDAISETTRTIMRGDLSGRMRVTGTGDELDRLATSLNEMLDQIERLMTAMREVTDNVAHDLKTPLTRMRARLEEVLRDADAPAESQREALLRTIGEADALLKTFDALLSIARTEAGEARTTMTEVDLGALLEDICELYDPILEDAGGRLSRDLRSVPWVRGDRQLLSQAVSNLLDNAVRHGADADGVVTVTVSAEREDDLVRVSVSDRGPGIAEGDRARAMERYVRLDTSRSSPGSGLGLSLVRGIARLHGGDLVLEDSSPGLRAVLSLPVMGTATEK